MIRAQQEWTKHRRDYGNGEWNYLTNEEGLKKFWTEGIDRNKRHGLSIRSMFLEREYMTWNS